MAAPVLEPGDELQLVDCGAEKRGELAPPHSITSSAQASTAGEMVIQSWSRLSEQNLRRR